MSGKIDQNREDLETSNIGRTFLSEEENLKIVEMVHIGRASLQAGKPKTNNLRAENILVKNWDMLVRLIARKYLAEGVELEDLIQEGRIGILRATDKFDPKRGIKFKTYARWWILSYITKFIYTINRTIQVPTRKLEIWRNIWDTEKQLMHVYGRESTEVEIAKHMGISTDELRTNKEESKHLNPISIETPLGDKSNSGNIGDTLSVQEDVEMGGIIGEFISDPNIVSKLITAGNLSTREILILELRYGLSDGECWTLTEVAKEIGLSRERIRQIEITGIRKIRYAVTSQSIYPSISATPL